MGMSNVRGDSCLLLISSEDKKALIAIWSLFCSRVVTLIQFQGVSSMLLEIQGLRGMAIIAVLLFHLWPEVFPNGYVGVDM